MSSPEVPNWWSLQGRAVKRRSAPNLAQIRQVANEYAADGTLVHPPVPADEAGRYYRILAEIALKSRTALVEVRCPREGHLLAEAHKTPWGPLVVFEVTLAPATREQLGKSTGALWAERQPARYFPDGMAAGNHDYSPSRVECHCGSYWFRHDLLREAIVKAQRRGKPERLAPVVGETAVLMVKKRGKFNNDERTRLEALKRELKAILGYITYDPPDEIEIANMKIEVPPAAVFTEAWQALCDRVLEGLRGCTDLAVMSGSAELRPEAES